MALKRGRGRGTVHSKVWLHSSLSGSDSDGLLLLFFCFYLQTDWTPELPSSCLIQTFQTSVTTWCLQLAEKAGECYTPVNSTSLLSSDRKQSHELAGILNDLFPFRISPAWEPAARMGCTFFFSQHQSCCGNLWVEIRHSFLSQWKWGETGNIPYGTIGYQRPQWPLPVGHGHESGSNRLHNRLCRGLTVAFSFTTWIKWNCAVSQPEFHLVISKLVELPWVRIKSAEEIRVYLKDIHLKMLFFINFSH